MNAGFATKYARAREAHADAVHDSMVEIEQHTLSKKVDPSAARTVLLSMQWRASKLAPKRYGHKIEATVTGPPLRHLSDAELSIRLAQVLKRSPEATAEFVKALTSD